MKNFSREEFIDEWNAAMKNFSREEFIEDWKDWGIKNGIYEMYSAKLSTEAEKRWSHTASQWKNINETQKEINFKATGIRETNLERKKREETKQKEINFKATGIRETNLERKKREELQRERKVRKRSKTITNDFKKPPGSPCFICKTKRDEKGYCFC